MESYSVDSMPEIHQARRRRAQEAVRELGADAVLITAGPNVRYLTGLASSNAALLLPAAGEGLLATDSRYALAAPRDAPDLELLTERFIEGRLAAEAARRGVTVTLVSKDTNLRIKSAILGIHAEDYRNDQVLEDVDLLYSGTAELHADFWDKHSKAMESWQEQGRTYYRITGPEASEWHPNQRLYLDSEDGFEGVVRTVENDIANIERAGEFRAKSAALWGSCAL